jgi:Meiotically up-regulated gene 113
VRDKQFILSEIRRVAAHNDGRPVGLDRFKTETGIGEHDWRGVYWARWSDALSEAGFEPLEWTVGLTVEEILEKLARLVRQYRKYPTVSEILIEKKSDQSIPGPKAVHGKLGARVEAIKKLRDYCSSREEYADVSTILAQENIGADTENGATESKTVAGKLKPTGHVYLVKSGRLYKIGQTANRWQRMNQLDKQTSEGIDEVIHTIVAFDDAPGIERYWLQRFEGKCVKGEWFDLSADDIRAFKKRKFM